MTASTTSSRTRAGLTVARVLDDFVAGEVLAPLGIDSDEFWQGYAALVAEFAPRVRNLLDRRDDLQALVDAWHLEHHGTGDPAAYRSYLAEIGYLEAKPAPFEVDVDGVDPEIATVAGPQLVVPLTNARYAINAANARWGSLFDAFYGTDVVPDDGPRAPGYDAARGERVIAAANEFLDRIVPLASGSHADAVAYDVAEDVPRSLVIALADGSTTTLATPEQFVGTRRDETRRDGSRVGILLRHHGLHLELVLDPDHPVGRQHPAGVADVVMEAAVTTIQDCEDSVAAVDADDKVLVYRNWLGLMDGSLEATFEKNDRTLTRRLEPDRAYVAPDGTSFELPGRSLLLVRNVGTHMWTDAVLDPQGRATPEGLLDAAVTVAIAMHDLRGLGPVRNSRTGSVYIVKPKLHGSDEVACTVDMFAAVEELLGLPECTVKVGIMDEERRTSLNLAACIAAARRRIIFINTGFLDRTGDEIHTASGAGPVVRKGEMRASRWLAAYEDNNVDVGLAAGMRGRAQIGKGMWAMPDEMAEMVATKSAHPMAGASCAWVPSPTSATLHAMHYHEVDVAARQQELATRVPASIDELLILPLLERELSPAEREEELASNAQSILGYVVRWIDDGVGCSKVPDLDDVALMEDRATLRISSQLLANWLRHGIVDRDQLVATFERMAAVVDGQNATDPSYRPMAADLAGSLAFQAALELVFEGTAAANGYTEPVLHAWRRRVKQSIAARSASQP
jgi:malate synthase